jgi:transposase-like protein
MKNSELSPEARKLRNEYAKNWKRKHPDKVRQYFKTYWERKVQQQNIDKQIISLHKQGYSLRQIASALKINHMKVKRIIDTVTKL